MTNAVASAGIADDSTGTERELAGIARRHAVCYEVWPE